MAMNFSNMDTSRVRSVVSMDEASQADTELSPEPSPVGPPAPQEFPSLPMNTNGSTMHYGGNNYSKQSPMVQHELFGGAGDIHSDDDNDESLPSLPDDSPSPYSAPPSSLFSGVGGEGEYFKKSNGKTPNGNGNSRSDRHVHYPPLSEVRLQQSAPPSAYSTRSMGSSVNVNHRANGNAAIARNRNDDTNDDDTFYSDQSLGRRMHRTLNQNPTAPVHFLLSPSASQEHWSPASEPQSLHEHHQQQQQQQQQHEQQQPSFAATTPGPAERSMLLPAVQTLKKELHVSHENMYLLQEENKALQDECGRYEELSGRWQQQADEQMAAAANREMALSQQVQDLHQQNEQVAAMNESLQQRVREALIGAELLSEQQQQANGARDEVEAKLRQVTREKEAANLAVTQLRQENERLAEELSQVGVSRDLQDNADEKLKLADEKVESLETKNAELITRMGELKKETNNKLRTVKTESEAELAAMRKENSSLGFEIDRLKATVKEQSRRGIKETAEVSANSIRLKEEIERLQYLLSESSDKTELEAVLADKQKENWSFGLEIDRLKAVVSEQKRKAVKEAAEASASVAKLEEEVDRLQTLSSSSNGKAELEAERVAKKREISSLGLEIDRLKAMVKEQGRRGDKETAETSANSSKLEEKVNLLEARLSESNGKNNGLRAEKLALRKELVQRHRSRNDVECQTDEVPPPTTKPTGVNAGTQTTGSQTFQAATQTSSLQTLQATTQTTTPISGAKSFGTQTGTDTTATITNSKSFGGSQTLYEDEAIHSIGPALSSSQKVTERLGRIRDAAERAALYKDYNRDLDRIKAQHETEKECLKTSHNEKMKNVVHNAKTELNSRSKEYKRRLQSEYDAKVTELESKHLQELTRVRTVCCSQRLSLMPC
jgi:hypothetical protein